MRKYLLQKLSTLTCTEGLMNSAKQLCILPLRNITAFKLDMIIWKHTMREEYLDLQPPLADAEPSCSAFLTPVVLDAS